MPRGYRLIDLRDEWVGGPALATRLVAADYRMTLLGLPRTRWRARPGVSWPPRPCAAKSAARRRSTEYDLRPLLIDMEVRPSDPTAGATDTPETAAAVLWMRLRNSQDLGSGRADEVVAAVADELGMAAIAAPGSGESEGEQVTGPDGSTEPSNERPALEMVRPVRDVFGSWTSWRHERRGGDSPARSGARSRSGRASPSCV